MLRSVTQIGAFESPSTLLDTPKFLQLLQRLQKPIKLSVGRRRTAGGYSCQLNPQLFIDEVACLESLEVEVPTISSKTKGTNSAPYENIASIIRQNPGIKDLHLRSRRPKSYYDSQVKQQASVEVEHGFAILGESVHAIRSLTLQGAFPQSTWSSWDPDIWVNLRTLSVMDTVLVSGVTERLTGQCANLQSVRLKAGPDGEASSSYQASVDGSIFRLDDVYRMMANVVPFLSSVSLIEIFLIDLQPDSLVALEESGSNLQRLLFHVRWSPRFERTCRVMSIFKNRLISPKGLATLQSTCSSLEWLAIDIAPFHLKDPGSETLYAPMAGHWTYRPSPIRLDWIASKPGSMYEDVVDPVFDALTRFRSLRRLRLYVHYVSSMVCDFNLQDAVYTFLWLQKYKEGALFESLVIYHELSDEREYQLCIVEEMGKGKVHAQVHAQQGGTIIMYEVGRPGTSDCLRELWRKDVVCDDSFKDSWERWDNEGFVVPIDWP
jgi:hypothetical protein